MNFHKILVYIKIRPTYCRNICLSKLSKQLITQCHWFDNFSAWYLKFYLEYLSDKIPFTIPVIVKTTTNVGPAKMRYSRPCPLWMYSQVGFPKVSEIFKHLWKKLKIKSCDERTFIERSLRFLWCLLFASIFSGICFLGKISNWEACIIAIAEFFPHRRCNYPLKL
jgi:hypothetical protein